MALSPNKSCVRWCCGSGWIVVVSVLMCIFVCSDGFNVDTFNFIRYNGEPGSMFGFSVAAHRERNRHWVLIGAPEAQTRQPNVIRGGAVYKCDITKDNACEEIPFDITGHNNDSQGRQIDNKSNQWFGATVRSSTENGVVMACAPRYVWFSTTPTIRRDPVGTCYVAKNEFTDFSEYSPCRTRNWGYHRQGSCQAGLGADVAKNGQRVYVGAPGSWYWQGQIYDITTSFKMPHISPDYSNYKELNLIEFESGNKKTSQGLSLSRYHNMSNQQNGEGQLFAQNPNNRPEVLTTSEGAVQDDDSYLGYSVAAGDFEGRGEGGVAVGMPRGAGLLGKVVLYSLNLTNLQNITGEQLGSYFSYSLAVIDVDGDSLDDIIVGAPLYTDLSNKEGKYETGRVYIFFQQPDIDDDGDYVRYNSWVSRDGKNSKCRFGLSLAALGDINKDGFGDFAVGAPYDGIEGRGAVYIYHGIKGGVRESYSQVIRAEDLSVSTSTFGFSLSGGIDMDGNQYPDLVVGAYESDSALFFRSRPVVKMVDARISFSSQKKTISLDEENCTLRDYTKVPCIYLQACLKYTGIEVEPYLDVDLGITLDSKKPKSPRMFFLAEEGKSVLNDTIRLLKGQLNCTNYYVYIKPNLRDKLTPLEAELRYNVKDTSRLQVGLGRRYRSLDPILDANDGNIQRDTISIQKNCGPDNICIPNLILTTEKSVANYLLGSGQRFILDVLVENRGEDAFEAMYNLQVPPGMNYINIEKIVSDAGVAVQCSAPNPATNNTLRCDIGNPLPRGKLVHFNVLLQPFYREGMKSSYNFKSSVNTTNPEDSYNLVDNVYDFTIPILVNTNLTLGGKSTPDVVQYNISHFNVQNITHESDIGPQVIHEYTIINEGPSDILEAETVFLWPSYTLAGDHLLYLLEQPETSGKIKCDWVDNVNEERIRLERKKKTFESTGSRTGQLTGTSSAGSSSKSTESKKAGGRTQSGSQRGKGQGKVKVKLSEEEAEIRRQEAEYSGGDASLVHSKRIQSETTAGGAASSVGSSGSSSGGSNSASSSASSSSSSSSKSQSGSSWSEERRVSQSSSSRKQQETVSGGEEANGHVSVGSRTGVGTEQVTHEDGSYRYKNREESSQGGSHFQWSANENNQGRRPSGGRVRTQERTEEEIRRQEAELRRQEAEIRRHEAEMERRRQEEAAVERRRQEVELERRRQEAELERRRVESQAGTTSTSYSRNRGRNEQERNYGARNNQVTSEEEALRRAYGQNEFRTVTLDLDPVRVPNVGVVDFGNTRTSGASQNELHGRTYQGSYDARGGSSRTNQFGTSYGRDEDFERRLETDTAAAEKEYDGKHFSSEFEYRSNSSWDSNTAGRPKVDSSSRWSVNDNGTVRSGSTSGYDSEYERRRHEEYARRLQEEANQRIDVSQPRQSSYYNTSYSSSERRYSTRTGNQDLPSRTNGRSRGPVSGENVEPGLNYQRRKRDHQIIPRFKRLVEDGVEDLENALNCGPTNCTRIRCVVGPLSKGQDAYVSLRGRVWVQTLNKIGYNKEVTVSSLQVSQVRRVPNLGKPHNERVKTFEVFTKLVPQGASGKPEVVPLWIVVLSACAGTVILLLLIFLLYKCGFFKRNRPTDVPEKQPLNRNGYANGDEAL